MKKILFLLVGMLLLVNIPQANTPSSSKTISASEFFSNPALYKDQVTSIKGMVKHVCSVSHQKLFLATDNGKNMVRVTISGGKKFADNLIGQDITVVGKVRAVEVADVVGCDGGNACSDDKKSSKDGKVIYYIECQSYSVN